MAATKLAVLHSAKLSLEGEIGELFLKAHATHPH